MMKKNPSLNRKFFFAAAALSYSLLLHSPESSADAIDPSVYSVRIKNFSEKVFAEKRSLFLLRSDDGGFSLSETPFQRIRSTKTNRTGTVVTVETGLIDSAEKRDPGNRAGYLRDTRFLNLVSPEVKKISSAFKMGGNILDDVANFVYGHITSKIVGIPLIPAVEIIRVRSGDCTEHSVLTVAILRSLGIPARAVTGMVIAREFMGKKNVFVFHMWAEAYFDGEWRLVDSTRPGENNPNIYVAFAYHSLQTETPLAYLKAVSSIQKLEAEYLRRQAVRAGR
ncbi:MAG: transglutaminase domain-containing protein [Spirochaetes bacterium]|jgi:hypothetical protein|nr:transglutaminase domain-containing protein [Spirochaetota bacterium]